MEARQAARPESLRGVHEQMIRLVDNMVQNYLGNLRRTVQRFNNFVGGSNRPTVAASAPTTSNEQQQQQLGQQLVEQASKMSGDFGRFMQMWSRSVSRQQSPLIDRIPPRGLELWRDFWDTMRKQMRRINQEFIQVSSDMGRLLTGGRFPAPSGGSPIQPQQVAAARPVQPQLYMSAETQQQQQLQLQEQKLREQFQEFYDKLTVQLSREQQKLEKQVAEAGQQGSLEDVIPAEKLADEQDDEATRTELTRNVALRQQIQQEINVFGSIFDIMRQFIQRLRESATHIRDVLTPPGSSNNNDAVTPGPSIKPQVDQLLEETVNSQRQINGQAKPVLLPQQRPTTTGNQRVNGGRP